MRGALQRDMVGQPGSKFVQEVYLPVPQKNFRCTKRRTSVPAIVGAVGNSKKNIPERTIRTLDRWRAYRQILSELQRLAPYELEDISVNRDRIRILALRLSNLNDAEDHRGTRRGSSETSAAMVCLQNFLRIRVGVTALHLADRPYRVGFGCPRIKLFKRIGSTLEVGQGCYPQPSLLTPIYE